MKRNKDIGLFTAPSCLKLFGNCLACCNTGPPVAKDGMWYLKKAVHGLWPVMSGQYFVAWAGFFFKIRQRMTDIELDRLWRVHGGLIKMPHASN
jgi:hypothetical protein